MKIKEKFFTMGDNTIVLRSPEVFEAYQLLIYFRNLFHESSRYLNFSGADLLERQKNKITH